MIHLILFAANTNIFDSNDDNNKLISTENTELNQVRKWMDQKLNLNVNKTNILIFGNCKSNPEFRRGIFYTKCSLTLCVKCVQGSAPL